MIALKKNVETSNLIEKKIYIFNDRVTFKNQKRNFPKIFEGGK